MSTDMYPEGAVQFMTDTFNQIVEDQEPDIACECHWHGTKRGGQEGSAEWIVRVRAPLTCGDKKKVVLFCDGCLQAVLHFEGALNCPDCGRHENVIGRHGIQSYEPIRPRP